MVKKNNMDSMDWVDKQEEKNKEERGKEYFDIVEGEQKFQLLTHCAPLPQIWNNTAKKYEVATEGQKANAIRGVCFVLQDGVIKLAKLPYTVVKSIRALQNNEDWDFSLPFEHELTLTAKGAKTKEVEYNLTASPKKKPIDAEIIAQLEKKDTPEQIIEKMKEKQGGGKVTSKAKEGEYPSEDIDPDDIPF